MIYFYLILLLSVINMYKLCITYFYSILLLSVSLSVITMYINFILDVELSQEAGHLYSTSWCTQFYLQFLICTIIVYICVKPNKA